MSYILVFRSPVRLCAAINKQNGDSNSSIIPNGEGFLLVLAVNNDGYIPVKA